MQIDDSTVTNEEPTVHFIHHLEEDTQNLDETEINIENDDDCASNVQVSLQRKITLLDNRSSSHILCIRNRTDPSIVC